MKTYFVRLFVPVDPAPSHAVSALHGVVEEIAGGRSARFADGQELLAFLVASSPGREPAPPERSST